MEESINTLFKVDEGSAVGNLNNRLAQSLSNRIALIDGIPRVLLKLLKAERDTLLIQVVTEDLGIDYITDIEDFLRIVHPAGPGELTDVCKAFDTRLDFNESTKSGDFGHRSGDGITNVVLCFEVEPGIFLHMLEAQVDLLGLWVNVDQSQLDNLALLHKVLGTGDVAPAHIVDMKKAVKSTEVDECTKGGE